MIIAVNMKGYRFGKIGNRSYTGFGMLDQDAGEFVSMNGRDPYVLDTKKLTTACIAAGWPAEFPGRVAHA